MERRENKKRISKPFNLIINIKVLLFLIFCSVSQAFAADHAVVLMYHRFGESKYPSTNISLEQFESHLQKLAAKKYTVLPLSKIVQHFKNGTDLPDHSIAITIDDAYLSVFHEAWPRLKAMGFPFTVFVATDPVDNNNPNYMSWEQLRQLQAGGAEIGSQTKTHPHMHKLSITKIDKELKNGFLEIAQRVGNKKLYYS